MAQLPQYDDALAQQAAEAETNGECLRFVGEHFAGANIAAAPAIACLLA